MFSLSAYIVQGAYPPSLLATWDDFKRQQRPPSDDQIRPGQWYIVLIWLSIDTKSSTRGLRRLAKGSGVRIDLPGRCRHRLGELQVTELARGSECLVSDC